MGGPGGMICSVATCKNTSMKAKRAGEVLSFFSFPKDRELRRKWVWKCYRKDKFDPTHKRVCSRHFKLDDFQDYIQANVMGTHPKRLKNTAVPSVNLLTTSEPLCNTNTKVEEYKNQSNQILELDSCNKEDYDILKRKYVSLEAESQILKQKIATQEQNELVLNRRIIELEKQLIKETGCNCGLRIMHQCTSY